MTLAMLFTKLANCPPQDLEEGYQWAYNEFYKWANIFEAATNHESVKHQLKHLIYTGGWKKFEGLWNVIINAGGLKRMLPFLELLLTKVDQKNQKKVPVPTLNSEKSQHILTSQ